MLRTIHLSSPGLARSVTIQSFSTPHVITCSGTTIMICDRCACNTSLLLLKYVTSWRHSPGSENQYPNRDCQRGARSLSSLVG